MRKAIINIVVVSLITLMREVEPVTTKPESDTLESASEKSVVTEIQALFDFESGLIFYKDVSIPACLVEKSSPSWDLSVFRIPVFSERDSENISSSVEAANKSKVGIHFCDGLPIYDINELVIHDTESTLPSQVRRRRQTNGYYRNVPVGEARARSDWNPPGQASQAQVQGQVFGSGFFSGQAQTQNGGVSQSQVQLAGVGIRGQIASSSGNAQAQLAVGNGAGSGQAAGLGEGPSSSQVQVSLGQQGEETMASASATSGGAVAKIGGMPGGGIGSGVPGASGGTQARYPSGLNGANGAARTPEGFYPGTRLFEDSSGTGSRLPYGGGAGGTSAGNIPYQTKLYQTPTAQTGNGNVQGTGIHQAPGYGAGAGGLTGQGGVGTPQQSVYSPGSLLGQNGFATGQDIGTTYSRLPYSGTTNGIGRGYQQTASGVNGGGLQQPGSGMNGGGFHQTESGSGMNGGGFQQTGSGSGTNGGGFQQTGSGINGGRVGSSIPKTSEHGYRTTGGSTGNGMGYGGPSGVGLRNGATGTRVPTGANGVGQQIPSYGSDGVTDSGGRAYTTTHGAPGTQTFYNGHRQTTEAVRNGMSYHGSPQTPGFPTRHGGTPVQTYRNGDSSWVGGPQTQGRTPVQTYRNGDSSWVGGPQTQGRTPAAYAATYGGSGQAQAQTVYFGYSGNGQIVPIRYEQNSQPGRGTSVTNGVRRFQDQQVGYGTAGQRQETQTGHGISATNGRTSTTGSNGYQIGPEVRNGHTSLPSAGGDTSGILQHSGGGTNGAGRVSGYDQPQPTQSSLSRDNSYTVPGLPPSSVSHPQQIPISHGQQYGSGTDASGLGHSTSVGHAQRGTESGGPSSGTTGHAQPGTLTTGYTNGLGAAGGGQVPTGYVPSTHSITAQNGYPQVGGATNGHRAIGQTYTPSNGYIPTHQQVPGGISGTGTSSQHVRNGQPYRINGYGQIIPAGQPRQTVFPTTTTITDAGARGMGTDQDGFSPSYGVATPSLEDPEGKKCTIITFSCTIVVESNGRAKICKPNAVKMNGNGAVNGSGSKICCC